MLKFIVVNLKYSNYKPELDSTNSYIVSFNFTSNEHNLHTFFFNILYYYYRLLIYVQFFYTQQFEYLYVELIVRK